MGARRRDVVIYFSSWDFHFFLVALHSFSFSFFAIFVLHPRRSFASLLHIPRSIRYHSF